MTFALTVLISHLGAVGVLVLAAVVFAETGLLFGFFLPGDSILFSCGVLVANGTMSLPLWLVIVLVWFAAVAGDQTGYWIGRRLGARFLDGRLRWLPARHVEHARRFFDRHGAKAVVLARFIALVRTFTPVVAGALGMPRRTFAAVNVLGGLVWTAGLLMIGYFFGAIPLVAHHVELLTLIVDTVAAIVAVAAFVIRRRLTRAEPRALESVPH